MTKDQIQTYHRRGYATIPRFFAEIDLQPVEDYLVRHQDVTWTDKNDDPLRESHYHHKPIYDLCTMPQLLDAVETLIGPDIVLLYTHILNKKAGGLGVAWHQDGPYWPRIEPKIAVTAWVPLDDADVENGCMQVIPGSHAGHVDYGQRQVDRADLIQQHAIELPPGVVDASKAENIILQRGDVSFHDSYIIHGSQPNRSTRRRAALTIRYVPSSTSIQPRADRKQYLVRGKAVDNGNVYFKFS